MRLFVGIELSADVRAALAQRLEMPSLLLLAPKGARFLPAEGWHLTLQFLGAVDDAKAAAVSDACETVARAFPSFAIEFASASAFPSARRARTLFIDVARGQEPLAALAARLHAATAPLGFENEKRDFRAHLTFARCKPDGPAQPLIAALASQPALTQPVDRLTLFRSHLSNRGARYEPVERWALRGQVD